MGLGKNEMKPKPETGQNFRLNDWLDPTFRDIVRFAVFVNKHARFLCIEKGKVVIRVKC